MTTATKSEGKSNVKPIPEGYHTVTPYIIVDRASEAIEFYKKAFGAKELDRMEAPGGKIMHAEIKIGDSPIMLADEHPEMGARSPKAIGGSPITIHMYVDDVDKVFNQAIAAGAKAERPVQDMFYGDRSGSVVDPYGHKWYISTHKEDLTKEEIAKRAQEMMKGNHGHSCGSC